MAQIFSLSFTGIVFFAWIGSFSLAPLPTQAAGFQVTPMFQEVILAEEKEKQIEVTLANTTEALGTFRLRVFDFGSLDDSGGVAFLGASRDIEAKYALASWMQPVQESVTLAPGQETTITILIKNEDTLSPGGHYGALVFEATDTLAGKPSNAIAVHQMIASLVFVKKVGGERYEVSLKSTVWERQVFRLPEKVVLNLENAGNVHIVPRGIVSVTAKRGGVVKKGIINPESALVLPESTRQYEVTLASLDGAWWPGFYRLAVDFRYDGKENFDLWTSPFFLYIPKYWSLIFLLGPLLSLWIFWSYFARKRRSATVSKDSQSTE